MFLALYYSINKTFFSVKATELHEQEYLRFTARREGKAMGDFSFFGAPVISQEFVEIDHNALDTMRRTNLSTCGVPSMTTGTCT